MHTTLEAVVKSTLSSSASKNLSFDDKFVATYVSNIVGKGKASNVNSYRRL